MTTPYALTSLFLSGSAAGWAYGVVIYSSSNGCTGSWSIRKLFAQMWNSLPSSISAMRHLYANWSLLEIWNSSFPVTTNLSRRSRLWSFDHFSLIFALEWKNLAWADPRAPIPPRFLAIKELWQNNDKIMPEYGRWCQIFTFGFILWLFLLLQSFQ